MEIGVVRHFPVPHNRYRVVDKNGFSEWIAWYDNKAKVKILSKPDITQEWDVCYSSDWPRTQTTATSMYKNEIIIRKQLREVPFSAFPFPLPLPIMAWKVLARIGWWTNMRFQIESRKDSLKRAKSIISDIISNHNNQKVLLVTHGFFMQYLNKELKKNKFKGKIPLHPKGGTVYRFTK